MPTRRSVFLIASAVGCLALAGCVSSNSPAASSSTSATDNASSSASATAGGSTGPAAGGSLVIGVVMAKSGFLGPIDLPVLNTLALEVEKVNAAGGIGGQKVELKVMDTQSKVDTYASLATQALDQGAKVLVVSCDYDITAPAALVAEAKNVLNISCAGDPIYGPAGGLKHGFSMGNGTPGVASVEAEFSYSKGWKNAVLLTDSTLKYTQNECAIFAKRYEQLGGKVLAKYTYKQGDTVTETVSKIANGAKADVIVNCGYTPGGVEPAKELRAAGIDTPIISGFGMDGDFWTGAVPGLKDYYVADYAAIHGDDPDPAVNETVKAYQARYGELPNSSGFVVGPAILQALKAAYDKAQSWDGDKLTTAMESFKDVPLLPGPTSFTKDLHIAVDRPVRIEQVVDGKLKFVTRMAPEQVVFSG